MFDIGFAELILVSVVGLLVIGPERLPGAIRTASLWLNRARRSFNDIKREVQQELHNDEVMAELRRTGEQLKTQTDEFGQGLDAAAADLKEPVIDQPTAETEAPAAQSADKREQ